MSRLASFLLLLTGLVLAVEAQEDNRFALVIGNAAYEGGAALAHSVNDAGDVAEALTAIGWKVTKVLDGDRNTLNKAVDDFHAALSEAKGPEALLYYAGHGVQINNQNYLIPVKETFETSNDIVHNAVPLQEILDAFADAQVTTDIVILDACRDNPFQKKNSRSLGTTRGLSVVSRPSQGTGSAVLFATAPGETAADGDGRNGVFTQAFLKYVKSDLPLQLLATKVAGEVKKLTGGAQQPYSSISLSDEYFLVPASMRSGQTSTIKFAGPTSFTLVVRGPEAGMSVLVDGKPVGQTPYQAKLDLGKDYTVEIQGQDYLPYKETVHPGNHDQVEVSPNLDHTVAYQRATLIAEKNDLQRQETAIRDKSAWVWWMGLAGWVGTGVGVAVAGYSYYAGNQALNDYNAATDVGGFQTARSTMNTMNTYYQVALVTGGVSLLAVVASLILSPNVSSQEKQIQRIDHQITLLGSAP